jgi:hypothetical protein
MIQLAVAAPAPGAHSPFPAGSTLSFPVDDRSQFDERGHSGAVQLRLPNGQLQSIQLTLSPADVHSPEELPNFIAGYRAGPYCADMASPVYPVDQTSDEYRTHTAHAFERVKCKTSQQGAVAEVDPKTALTPYRAVVRACGSFIPTRTEQSGTKAYKPRQAAAKRVARVLRNDREWDVFGDDGLLGTSDNFGADHQDVLPPLERWGDLEGKNPGANADPLADLDSIIDKSYQPPTDIWMNGQVAKVFIKFPQVLDLIRGTYGDQNLAQTLNQVRSPGNKQIVTFELLGYPPIHVCTAKLMRTVGALPTYILGPHVVLTGRPEGADGELVTSVMDDEEIMTSITFRLREANGQGWNSREYFIEGRGHLGGTMVVMSQEDIAVVVAPNVGGFIGDVLQA